MSKQNFEAYTTVKLPISIKVKANNEEQALEIAQEKINTMTIEEIKLLLRKLNGEHIEPTVHDIDVDDIDIDNVFKD